MPPLATSRHAAPCTLCLAAAAAAEIAHRYAMREGGACVRATGHNWLGGTTRAVKFLLAFVLLRNCWETTVNVNEGLEE